MAAQDQRPIGSGFGRTTTADEIVGERDLTDRSYIVTGGYSGLGLETVRVLAAAGAAVTVPARSRAKAQAALAGLTGAIEVADMDLGTCRACAGSPATTPGAAGRCTG
jgi:NAD(P)-dependent dehydrogenase (short-subunit alcohol dehydrogenase family)